MKVYKDGSIKYYIAQNLKKVQDEIIWKKQEFSKWKKMLSYKENSREEIISVFLHKAYLPSEKNDDIIAIR